MTRLEEAVWAAAYVQHTAALYAHGFAGTRVDTHKEAVHEADTTVMSMRRASGYAGRLHYDQTLEEERLPKEPLYRMPAKVLEDET